LWQQNSTYPANVDRRLINTLWPSSGGGGAASTVAGTMQVSVAAGTAEVLLSGAFGTALCWWDAAETVTLAAAPPSGQSRVDLVVLQVRDTTIDAGSNNDFVFAAVTGTPATSNPAVPTVPANAYAVCQVTVPGAAVNLNTATLVDRRAPQLVGGSPTAPLGLLPGGLAQIVGLSGVANQTAVPVSGMGVNVATLAGRRYRVRAVGNIAQTAGAVSMGRVYIYADNTTRLATAFVPFTASAFAPFVVDCVIQPGAGNHNYTVYLSIDAGSVVIQGQSDAPAYIAVEDIGGN
jgi:hypothetical protein